MRNRLASLWRQAVALLHLGADLTARFAALAGSIRPTWLPIVLFWFVLVVPAISLRGYHYEEGTVIALARGALEEGHWLEPHHYGNRFVERPVLMSWLIAVLAAPFGTINEWIARIPAVLSLLLGGLLVFSLVRSARTSAVAALFAVACLFVCPMQLQKVITAEPDMMLSVLLFAAFVTWWFGHEAGRVSLLRWLMIGLILTAAGLSKGPQPLAYFALGVGAFLLIRRRWAEVPGFFVANAIAGAVIFGWYFAIYQPGDIGTWLGHSHLPHNFDLAGALDFLFRLSLELLPALLLVIPGAVAVLRGIRRADPLLTALLLYAVCTTAVLVFWPIARTRYAMPSTLALAAIAGLMYDRIRVERPLLANVALIIVFWLGLYRMTLGWLVMPLIPDLFQEARIEGRIITAAMEVRPGTLYVLRIENNNTVLAYVPTRIRDITLASFAAVQAPSWAMIPAGRVAELRAMRPDLNITQHAILREGGTYHLLMLARK